MKRLDKLQIKTDRLIKSQELLTLKGGYSSVSIKCYSEGWIEGCMGYLGTVNGDCNDWYNACREEGYQAFCATC